LICAGIVSFICAGIASFFSFRAGFYTKYKNDVIQSLSSSIDGFSQSKPKLEKLEKNVSKQHQL